MAPFNRNSGHGSHKRMISNVQRTRTDLPESLLTELQSPSAAALGPRDERLSLVKRKKGSAGLSRKDKRKQAKVEKKDKKRFFHSSAETQAAMLQKQAPISKSVVPKISAPTPDIPSKPVDKTDESKKFKDQKEISEKEKLEKLKTANPAFYDFLVSSNLASDPSAVSNLEEDKDLKRYGSLLKIKKGKLPKSFTDDGLDELLGDLGTLPTDMSDAEFDEDESLSLNEDVDGEMEELDEDFVDESAGLEMNEMDSYGESSGSEEVLDMASEGDMESFSEMDESDVSVEEQSEPEEELSAIEEKKHDTSGAAVKYIPPHLRKAQGAIDENRLRLQRQIKGLINRLSDSNMESILSEIDIVYQSHSRHDVTDVLTDFLLETVGDTAKLIDSFVQTHAALIACLYNSVGVEFGSHLIEKCVVQIADDSLETKKRGNLITLIGYLYLFDVLTCVMVYDYVRDAISRLEEIDVEVLLRLLRICGQKLRSDDPSALKDIILLLKAELAKRDPESISTRLKFMVESVMDLKNNKHKKKKADADGSQGDRLKKFVVNLVRKRGLNGTEALRVGVKDIQDIKVKGKWWLVGSAWAGRDSVVETQFTPSTAKNDEISNDLLLLAKSQKMNTDVRRSIFVVLMTSEDYADAYERLLKLGLKDKQEREIARVIVQCCSKEKVFNPYYAHLAQRFCSYLYSFKITFQYVLWDIIKTISSTDAVEYQGKEGIRRISNLGKFYLHLLSTQSAPITILKSLSFTSLSPLQTLFCQIVVGGILSLDPEDSKAQKGIKDIFSKSKEATEEFREGLAFFISQYMSPKSGDVVVGVPETLDRTLLKNRVKFAKTVLAGRNI